VGGALFALLLAACGPAIGQQGSDVAPPDVPITEQWRGAVITARPVDLDPRHPGPRRLGQLIFRGGVSMTADVPELGGLSGLYVGLDGRFLAVSDRSSVVTARLISDPVTAAPLRFEDAGVAGLRDENGERFYETGLGDAEGMAPLPDGRFAVSFERSQLIRYYDLDRLGPFGRSVLGATLAEAGDLEPNAGLEALAYAGEGRLLVGAERGAGGAMLWLAPIDADAPARHVARLPAPIGYGFTGADRLPDGDFVLLQRFYAPVVGVRIRILRLDGEALARGDVETEVLATLAPPLNLDNFESVSAIPTVDGGARLYLISDDNYSATQRTLLYVFDLPPDRSED
jgi:hypothetical protein